MECKPTIKEHITSDIWKKCFPKNYKEIEYSKFHYCSFNLIIDLINEKTSKLLTINQLKHELYEEYKKYLSEYTDKILDILIIEGKKTLGDQVHAGSLTFSNFIYTDNYFLTPFDLWILVNKYEIPTIFISQKWILQTEYKKHEFLAYGNERDNFVFIVLPGLRNETIPKYKIIQTDKEKIFISLDKLEGECNENILEMFQNKITIEDYLKNFTKPITTKYGKKKPIIILSESESEEIIKPKRKRAAKKISPISEEEEVVVVKQGKKSKKALVKNNSSTKRNVKSKIKIISSSSENV